MRWPGSVSDASTSAAKSDATGLWFEITALVPPDQVEAVAETMRAVAPGGVTIDEPVDILGPEMGFKVRKGERVGVKVYLPSSELGAILTEELRRAMEAFPEAELTAKPIYQQDWEVSWREFFGVVDHGGRVIIVPSWIEHESKPGQLAIRLDPGQAFGTGHHETTRLCIAALERHIAAGMRMLDVGTGSGILAIAAVLLGAEHVLGIDIDRVAIDVARENCEINGVADRVTLEAGVLAVDHPETYAVVVANISTAANLGLADIFARVVAPGSTLILSGILAVDSARVISAMEATGHLRHGETRVDGDWCLIELTGA